MRIIYNTRISYILCVTRFALFFFFFSFPFLFLSFFSAHFSCFLLIRAHGHDFSASYDDVGPLSLWLLYYSLHAVSLSLFLSFEMLHFFLRCSSGCSLLSLSLFSLAYWRSRAIPIVFFFGHELPLLKNMYICPVCLQMWALLPLFISGFASIFTCFLFFCCCCRWDGFFIGLFFFCTFARISAGNSIIYCGMYSAK